MKRLMLSSTLLLTCMAMMFYLSSGNALQINRSDLLLWRITLYAAMSGVGWRLYDRFLRIARPSSASRCGLSY